MTIIFQEPGALPFTPKNIRSHFQHVFIIVRAHSPCTDNVCYRYMPRPPPACTGSQESWGLRSSHCRAAKTEVQKQCGSGDSLTSAHTCPGIGMLPFLALSSAEAPYRSFVAF